jgi:hypothetical protein
MGQFWIYAFSGKTYISIPFPIRIEIISTTQFCFTWLAGTHMKQEWFLQFSIDQPQNV